MPSRFSAEIRAGIVGISLLIVIAVSATFLLHGKTRDFGFDYDDYHFVRPYPRAEVLAAFHGSWDPTGIEVPFYRPLTVALYAARFELFGLNASAHHQMSLLLFACAAALVGLFGWWATGHAGPGLLAEVFFIVHPSMPYAQVAWITNQMHLFETLLVLTAVLWWVVVRGRPVLWWLPLLALGTAAFLVKEDGIMLIPVVLVLHWLRRQLVEPGLPPVPRAFLGAAIGMVVALIALRGEALGGRLGGYGRPGLEQAFQNYVKGLNSVLRLQPAHREWQLLASIFATALPVLALGLWRRATPGARYVLLAGIAMTLLFNLPFVFVSKIEQMHLVTLGSVLLLAGSGAGLVSSSRKPTVIAVSVLALAGGAAAMAAVASDISDDFAPFSPVVRYHDTIVKDWAAVPQELRDYLRQKLQPGAEAVVPPNPLEALTVVSWGLHPPERSPGGLEYRWMSGSRAEIHVSPRVQEVFIPIRHAAEAFREPATARIEINGRRVDSLLMEDADWRTSRVRVGALRPPRLARFHRIVIAIDHAWIPALLHPRSNDHRTLGLQIGTLQLR